jgi:hypothetical protein
MSEDSMNDKNKEIRAIEDVIMNSSHKQLHEKLSESIKDQVERELLNPVFQSNLMRFQIRNNSEDNVEKL